MWTMSSSAWSVSSSFARADFGGEAAEPVHERHLVVGGDYGEEEAVFGGGGGGGPEFARVSERFAGSRSRSASPSSGRCARLDGGLRIDEHVVAAERAGELAGDQLFGDGAGVLRRDVQLRGERIHEAAAAGGGVAGTHVAEGR